MMTENSVSSSSRTLKSHRSSNVSTLASLESGVFHKIINLKNEKIGLLTQLSQAKDARYRAEDELLQALSEKKRKDEQIVSKEEYEPVIRKYYQLKDLAVELERKSKENHPVEQPNHAEAINQIIQQRLQNRKLELQLQHRQEDSTASLNRLKQRMKTLRERLQREEHAHNEKQEGRRTIRQERDELQHFLDVEEEEKRLLYGEVLEFKEEMENLYEENERLKTSIGQSLTQNK